MSESIDRAPSNTSAVGAQMSCREWTRWTEERHALMVQMAESGCSASDVARVLGVSRSAVLGRAHREGIPFHGFVKAKPKPTPVRDARPGFTQEQRQTARRMYLDGASYREIADAIGCARGTVGYFSRGLPRRRTIFCAKRYDRSFKIMAVALVFSGYGFLKTCRRLQISARTLHLWRENDAIANAARPAAEQIRAEAEVRRIQREDEERQKRAQAESERLRLVAEVAVHNAFVLPRLKPQVRLVVEARLAGDTLQAIGDRLGVTRERVRQLEVIGRREGIRFPDDTRKPIPAPEEAASGHNVFVLAHDALDKRRKRPMNLMPEERERRREWGREIARRRWGAEGRD